ncbi:hypothetical protein RB653_001678 [Dictyostelium firmibasis]|uniref:Uncharacterized protein n=1 Tax=Dictyostelium firmibasis TaxID=79012 RepID=A0AAN7YVJ8_9MYCE
MSNIIRYTEEPSSSVIYTTTSYNVNSIHQKGKSKLKLFPRFSRKKNPPPPMVVDHRVSVTPTQYGGVVYPTTHSVVGSSTMEHHERHQISQQYPTHVVAPQVSHSAKPIPGEIYYESSYHPNTYNHSSNKYYCPPPLPSTQSQHFINSSKADQIKQTQQYEDSILLNSNYNNHSYGGTNENSINGRNSINLNKNQQGQYQDQQQQQQQQGQYQDQQQYQNQQQQYQQHQQLQEQQNQQYNNNNNNNNNNKNNNNVPPPNVDYIYPPGYINNEQPLCDVSYPMSSEGQALYQHQQTQYQNENWDFTVHNVDPSGENNN